jgi:hypothetical protein
VTWREIDRCAKSADPMTLHFETDDVLRRIDKLGDLFSDLIRPKARTSRP